MNLTVKPEVPTVWRHFIKRDKSGNPVSGRTLCAVAANTRPAEKGQGFIINYVIENAICNKKDKFSRKLGRHISFQRAVKGRDNCAITLEVGYLPGKTDEPPSDREVRKYLLDRLADIVKTSRTLRRLEAAERLRHAKE